MCNKVNLFHLRWKDLLFLLLLLLLKHSLQLKVNRNKHRQNFSQLPCHSQYTHLYAQMCVHTSKESLNTDTMAVTGGLWSAHGEIMKLEYFTLKVKVLPKYMNGKDQPDKTSKGTSLQRYFFLFLLSVDNSTAHKIPWLGGIRSEITSFAPSCWGCCSALDAHI